MTTETRVRAARDLHRLLGSRHAVSGPGALAAVLENLRAVVGFDSGHLSEWSAATQQNTVLSVLDWPTDLLDLWKEHISREPSFLGMRPDAPILRAVDVPPRERTGFLFEETFLRPKLADALSFRLWSPDGRFVGTVSATVAGRSPFDDLAVSLLELLGPRLGALFDPVPDLWPLDNDLAGGRADGLVVDRAGRATRLTDGADAGLAGRDGPLWPLIHSVANGGPPMQSALLLVGDRVLSIGVQASRHGVVVLHRTVPAPFGLSTRELQVLGALAGGATNKAMAARFALTPRTVATYIERVLIKTGCPNRTAAAQLATRLRLTTR